MLIHTYILEATLYYVSCKDHTYTYQPYLLLSSVCTASHYSFIAGTSTLCNCLAIFIASLKCVPITPLPLIYRNPVVNWTLRPIPPNPCHMRNLCPRHCACLQKKTRRVLVCCREIIQYSELLEVNNDQSINNIGTLFMNWTTQSVHFIK